MKKILGKRDYRYTRKLWNESRHSVKTKIAKMLLLWEIVNPLSPTHPFLHSNRMVDKDLVTVIGTEAWTI